MSSRALAFVRAVPDHPLLDRLIRGRAWIPVLGVMLAGIVAMQVEVLKLGTSIGRSIERSGALQTRNDQLRLAVAALDGDERIERLAAASGMIMPAPDAVGFLSSQAGALVPKAVANIHSPDGPSFLALTTSNGAIATVSSSLAASTGSSTYAAMQTAGPDPSLSSPGSASSGATQLASTSASTGSSSQSPPSAGQSSPSGGTGIPAGG